MKSYFFNLQISYKPWIVSANQLFQKHVLIENPLADFNLT